jgi:hypothetical protein
MGDARRQWNKAHDYPGPDWPCEAAEYQLSWFTFWRWRISEWFRRYIAWSHGLRKGGLNDD